MRPKKRILIVDANCDRAGCLQFALYVAHFDVRSVISAEEARTAVDEWRPELIIAAWPAPSIALRPLFDGIRRDILTPIPTMLLMQSQAAYVEAAEAVCVDAYRVKPPMSELIELARVQAVRKRGPRKGTPKKQYQGVAAADVIADRRLA